MKNRLLTGLAMILVLTALGSGSASAQDSDDLRTKVDVGRFPELTVERYGVFQGDNLLDPKSSNYDPSLRYGPDGTRFGPPAKRNLDFYRSMGLVLGEDSLNLEKDRKKGDPWPGEGDYGTIINDGLIIGGQGVSETQAYQKIYTDLYLNGDDKVLYAPSMLAPDYCRLEAVIRYNRDNGTTERHFAIFTHSETTYGDGDWTNVYTLDQGAFQYQYVTGADEVIVKITKSGQESNPLWTVYLYDIVDSTWDYVTSVYGKSTIAEGWDFWEQSNLDEGGWPSLPEITSRYLMVKIGSTNYWVTGTEGYVRDYGTNPYTDRGYNANYYDWWVGPGSP